MTTAFPSHATIGTTITSEGVLGPGTPVCIITPVASFDDERKAIFWCADAGTFIVLGMSEVAEPNGLGEVTAMLQAWAVEDDIEWHSDSDDDEIEP